jgi:hypothetical protein
MAAVLSKFGYGLLTLYVSSNQTNLDLSTLFGTTKYQAKINKKIIINSGVTVGATNTSNYALNIPSGFGGRIYVVNNGSIQGAGGAANSGTGGNVIFAGAPKIYIDNRGTIYAGGGGGGTGGTGGAGSFTTTSNQNVGSAGVTGFSCNPCDAPCIVTFGSGAFCASGCSNVIIGRPTTCTTNCITCQKPVTTTTNTAGGAGGAGGVGQGYNQTNTGGSAGSAGGTNAGTGGTGGTGGTWGTTGDTGQTGANGNAGTGLGGAGGGLAGFYITNNSNITWIATGTVAGRVG